MPVAVGEGPRSAPQPSDSPAPVIGIRTQSLTDSRMGKLVVLTMLVGIAGVVASFVAVNMFREGSLKPRVVYNERDQGYLQLSHDDDYYSVVRKLGKPDEDRWQSETGAIQFRSLWYPEHAYSVILMGDSRASARYIGTMDANWNPIHGVAA
jgi:hypothetical protein